MKGDGVDVCLMCDLHRQHGGKKNKKVQAVYVTVPQFGDAILGYVQKWKDPAGNVWWTAMHGLGGHQAVPITSRSQAFREAGGAVIPLFGSSEDATHALKVALGLAVDA